MRKKPDSLFSDHEPEELGEGTGCMQSSWTPTLLRSIYGGFPLAKQLGIILSSGAGSSHLAHLNAALESPLVQTYSTQSSFSALFM